MGEVKRQYTDDAIKLVCELLEYQYIGNSDIANVLDINKSMIGNIRDGSCYADISANYKVKECPPLKLIKSTNKYSSVKREILSNAKDRADKLKENGNFFTK